MERVLDRGPKAKGRGHDSERATPTPEQKISGPAMKQRSEPLAPESGITIGGAIAQAKLAVGPSNDPYECEADLVAARVVRLLQSEASSPGLAETEVGPRVQRSSAVEAGGDRAGGDTASRVRLADARPAPSRTASRISRVQRSAVVGAQGGDLDDDTARMLQRSRSGGAPLPEPARSKMEGAFGADFSGVRVHAGPTSTELNNRIQAKAFTTGSDIFFRDGVPDATTGSGQELLAHELTHTIQQGAAGRVSRSTGPIQRDVTLEVDSGGGGDGGGGDGGAVDGGAVDGGHDELLPVASPTTLSELALSAAVSHESWATNDGVLLDMLRGPFEANWFKAKACLAMNQWPLPKEHVRPSHDVGIKLMQAMVDMRGRM
ncbi:DUF4157 domain-containing protein [Ilumatobacter sp.]|uniref:eCIS core domain-containing protein n=1 Tax=Ilumatobacter sp. TaxID=1967498 RepID=UPI0037525F59